MKYQTMVERLVAIGLVVFGVLINNYVIAGIGIAYFILKIPAD